jgi:hypothetical protein
MRWKWKVGIGVALSLLTAAASTSQAFVGDGANLKAPGLGSRGLNMQIVVRAASGSIWAKNLQPTQSIWFNTPGNPPGGTSSGPQVAFVGGNTGTPSAWWIVRGPYPDDRIWVNKQGAGWEPNTIGKPAGVAQAFVAPAVYSDGNNGVVIVSLDTTLRPWFKRLNNNGTLQTDWAVFQSTTTLQAAPGVAMNFSTGKISTFGVLAAADLRVSTCGFPTCFTSWDVLPGGGVTNTGFAGASFQYSDGNVFTAGALLGTDNQAWFNQDENGGGYGGWHQRWATATADSEPGACYFASGFTNEPALAVHRADGNYWLSMHGTTWTNLGHP